MISVSSAVDPVRRRLLAGAAAVAGLTLAPGVYLMTVTPARARAAGEAVSDKVRWGLLIDTNRLPKAACDAMVAACNAENGLAPGSRPEVTAHGSAASTSRTSGGAQKFAAGQCQHSRIPAVRRPSCPTGASFRRADGIDWSTSTSASAAANSMLACPTRRAPSIQDVTDRSHIPRAPGHVSACTMSCTARRRPCRPSSIRPEGCPRRAVRRRSQGPGECHRQAGRQAGGDAIRADLGVEPGVLYTGI
jgi:molybdopterin-containing oxidoreductase family iron-sulfur binding subunit